MSENVFTFVNLNVTSLLSNVQDGSIALPDIQRPFVWKNNQVRDLFDSMYKGFPVGNLLLWATTAEPDAKQIGTEIKQMAASQLIIDGQQRLTSLHAVINGAAIVRNDFSNGRISIAFRPNDEKFEVLDAAVRNDPEFIPDISEVFREDSFSFISKFHKKVEEYRGYELDDAEKNRLAKNIGRLQGIKKYSFQTIVLDKSIDEERVADIFVRINSKGVKLNSADFILTLMSIFWDKGRQELELFSRNSKLPSSQIPSPYNYFIQPSPDQLLRTSVGLAFRRGNLRYIYSMLRGKNLETGEISQEWRETQFESLQTAHEATLDLTNWHEYLKCIRRAGFRSKRMVSSETAVMYIYILWLIGRIEYNLGLPQLREVIARWWFMAHTTSRYTNSPETQIEADLKRLQSVAKGDSAKFCELLDHIVNDTFTGDYWDITLPNRLDTSSNKSPTLSAYWAALNILDAEVLFSTQKVSEMLDPAITPIKSMERHHLFPRSYLRKINITNTIQVDAIANMGFVDWIDNVSISDTAPCEYWPQMTRNIEPGRLKKQMHWHALPHGWERMDYYEFLETRRKLIAQIVKEGFERLCQSMPLTDSDSISLSELISFGESNALEFKESARWSYGTAMKNKSEQIIVKSIAGFANTEGGTLLIGVSDDGTVKGIESDYATLSKGNRDGYELFLKQLIKNKLGGYVASLCRISFHNLMGKDTCRVDVLASSKPVFVSDPKTNKQTDFWVRLGNRTDQLFGSDLVDYTKNHWG